jgi:hypothetical protein
MSPQPLTINVQATTPENRDEKLEAAVKKLQQAATVHGRHGILVTRHEPGAYTVALSEDVPFGITREAAS